MSRFASHFSAKLPEKASEAAATGVVLGAGFLLHSIIKNRKHNIRDCFRIPTESAKLLCQIKIYEDSIKRLKDLSNKYPDSIIIKEKKKEYEEKMDKLITKLEELDLK
jgi:hypothetical protein